MQYAKYRSTQNCLRKHRKICGLKQKDVANILGLKSTSRISRWEKGVTLPSGVSMLKLAVLYRTMVDSLFSDLIRKLREEIREAEKNYYETRQ